ncbi:MAG: valine--tRNA ligase [Candidatus Margulisiibacteriota bacterium]
MTTELPKAYSHKEVEEPLYHTWEQKSYFSPDGLKGGTFSIVIPPPNVTGSLHMGHALDNTLQDILVRYKRMKGFKSLWVPGTDHAGIATQNVVEKDLAKEKKRKEDIGREQFLERVWAWKEKFGGAITGQLRRLGASCDWKRERFTMDEGLSKAVRRAFVQLYKEGLIYKGKKIINWCPRCSTALSDIEVEHENQKGKLYFIRYSKDIVVATTRPETMLGDTGVAVNPSDERYRNLIGKVLELPLVGRKIPVIADELVDPSFGTGAVKVTPAHDAADFEMGEKHNLPKINILTKNGKITLEELENLEKQRLIGYVGLDRFKAREAIVADLEKNGFLEKTQDYDNSLGKCYRCKTVIEPYNSDQWFVKIRPLAEPAIKAVEDGSIRFVPERWGKVYLDWMINLKDWCISRQIWWGHRVPVWYCSCGEVIAAERPPLKCPGCGSKNLRQDEDVLDTWFSSSLWPFSTLGWPEETADLKEYYPTSVLITGYDIITFWVSRMIMMGLKFMGKEPFKTVYIHGLIRDISGKKMSKSLGNVIDPIGVIDRVGADALRFSLSSLVTAGGQDLKLSEEKITEGRNFANKIWNVARFVLMQEAQGQRTADRGQGTADRIEKEVLALADKWILSRLNLTIGQATQMLDSYQFGEAAKRLYEFVWSEFCDWYIEMSKPQLLNNSEPTLKVLNQVLLTSLKLLHPFMPFETEELYGKFPVFSDKCPNGEQTIMLAEWPTADESLIDESVEKKMGLVFEVIRAIRNLRADMNIQAGKPVEVFLEAGEMAGDLLEAEEYIKALTRSANVKIEKAIAKVPPKSAKTTTEKINIYIPLEGLVDFEKEALRLKKSLEDLSAAAKKIESKLATPSFTENAKPELVELEKQKLKEYLERRKVLEERISVLTKN